MKLKDFDYNLPRNLIAQQPVKPRNHSRLLILERETGKIKHQHFYNIIDYLKAGDVLVLNNTKVMPARLIGKKAETGGKVEVFLLKRIPPLSLLPGKEENINPPYPPLLKGAEEVWQCLIGGKRRKDNLRVEFAGGVKADILKNNHDGASASLSTGTWNVKFNKSGQEFMKIVERIGRVPLPPYIKRDHSAPLRSASLGLSSGRRQDRQNYQTVYADDRKVGSVAAPTAGFHFTKKLIKQLKKKGVQFEYVTLQVGLGTFAPVKVDDITKHKMHAEWVEASKKTMRNIIKAKSEGRRIIAVGTTSARVLESVFKNYSSSCHCEERKRRSNLTYSKFDRRLLRHPEYGASRNDKDYSGWTDIFIYPGYKFKAVDAMITNFHLPKSTLLMLVSALAGRNIIFKAYQEAIKKKYRFYSYGDAMLII